MENLNQSSRMENRMENHPALKKLLMLLTALTMTGAPITANAEHITGNFKNAQGDFTADIDLSKLDAGLRSRVSRLQARIVVLERLLAAHEKSSGTDKDAFQKALADAKKELTDLINDFKKQLTESGKSDKDAADLIVQILARLVAMQKSIDESIAEIAELGEKNNFIDLEVGKGFRENEGEADLVYGRRLGDSDLYGTVNFGLGAGEKSIGGFPGEKITSTEYSMGLGLKGIINLVRDSIDLEISGVVSAMYEQHPGETLSNGYSMTGGGSMAMKGEVKAGLGFKLTKDLNFTVGATYGISNPKEPLSNTRKARNTGAAGGGVTFKF